MPDNVKVIVTERNGIDVENEELTLTGSNITFDNSSNGFVADELQSAIEEVGDVAAPLRVPIPLIHNGTFSNRDFIGYSNLLDGIASPIVAPITGALDGFTFSNKNSSADFALEFRKNTTGGAAFFTWSVDNTQTASVTLPSPESFSAGDVLYIKYVDQGSNARDSAIILLFKA